MLLHRTSGDPQWNRGEGENGGPNLNWGRFWAARALRNPTNYNSTAGGPPTSYSYSRPLLPLGVNTPLKLGAIMGQISPRLLPGPIDCSGYDFSSMVNGGSLGAAFTVTTALL